MPFGAVTVIGRFMPSLKGMSGLVSADLTQESVAEIVEAQGQLRLRLTWPQVPAKSTSIVSPAIVTVAFTTSGSSLRPSSSTASSP